MSLQLLNSVRGVNACGVANGIFQVGICMGCTYEVFMVQAVGLDLPTHHLASLDSPPARTPSRRRILFVDDEKIFGSRFHLSFSSAAFRLRQRWRKHVWEKVLKSAYKLGISMTAYSIHCESDYEAIKKSSDFVRKTRRIYQTSMHSTTN